MISYIKFRRMLARKAERCHMPRNPRVLWCHETRFMIHNAAFLTTAAEARTQDKP